MLADLRGYGSRRRADQEVRPPVSILSRGTPTTACERANCLPRLTHLSYVIRNQLQVYTDVCKKETKDKESPPCRHVQDNQGAAKTP